ncbi:MAG: hypothetical protein OQK12_12410 [Motiliproteus sp.]|nr:hypothetical protein [Motiliproteus sp.]MCW9052686.1 hypothetical protein [Motiliproteus sp.]
MSAWSKKKAPTETHQTIEEQTKAFLESGGKIQQIDTGVTGQEKLSGPRHIVLGKKATK